MMNKLWKFLFVFTWVVLIATMVLLALLLASNSRESINNQNIINQFMSQGKPALTNYDLAVKNGFVGTESEYLASLKGQDSQSTHTVKEVEVQTVKEVHTIEQVPVNGKDALNNYDLWLGLGNKGTIEDYFATLKGKDGVPLQLDIRLNTDTGKLQTKLPTDTFWKNVQSCGASTGRAC